jgi:hypothetical protein
MANADYDIVRIGGRAFYKHRLVWELENGPIPIGHVVHHKDGNRRNNDLSNLELLSRKAHCKHHQADDKTTDIDAYRAMKKAAGASRSKVEIVCVECGQKATKTKARQGNKFCSVKCKQKARKAA